jgi:hypothetical protein
LTRSDSTIHTSAQPEKRRCGATWKVTSGTTGGCGTWGNLGTHRRRSWRSEPSGQPETSRPAKPRDARREETRASIAGKAGRSRTRGNPGPRRRRNRWNEDSGRPGDSPPGPPKDARREETQISIAGTARKDVRCGATRTYVAGVAAGCRRGNPRKGNPGNVSAAKTEDAGPWATGSLIAKLDGKIVIR